MELETTPQKVRERIYIGGLNPPRLSGKDILRRLKSLDRIEIESSSIADNDEDEGSDSDYIDTESKPYLHITAISNDDSVSALSILHKHYHNVKWKGCKLVVEPAKPHFLERLAQERRDRETKEVEVISEELVAEEAASRIPRRLRVRKKFGDTAVHIDTKPWTVETWSRFHKALTKLKKQKEKHNTNTLASSRQTKGERIPSPGPLMHRAVHIRFETDGTSIANLDRSNENHNDPSGMISSSESSSSSSSSSESESDSESSDENVINNDRQPSTPRKYEWSDDDDDSDSEDSEPANTSVKKELNKGEDDRKNETYHWSTDEDSEDDDQETSLPSKDKRQLKPVSATQEFAAGFDDASSFSYDEDKYTKDEGDFDLYQKKEKDNTESDLVGDVTSNLNILSSIFPDMASTRPVNVDSEANSKVDNENSSSSADEKKKKNKPNLGFMPRFDPTAKSSEQYIIEDEDKEENDSSIKKEESDEDAMDDSDDRDDSKTKNDTRQKLPDLATVYEQDKLENVFRDARDTWKQDDAHDAAVSGNSTANSNPAESEKSSSFSFGFNLDDNNNSSANKQHTSESNSATTGFSFGFNVSEPDSKDEPATPKVEGDSPMEDPKTIKTEALSSSPNDSIPGNDSDEEIPKEETVQRQKGLNLPDEDLQKYVDNFFGCNNGIRIMQNPQEFMNDEKERAEWNNERQTLTLDWKRKRKYAITRIQKRMKVRRR